MGIARQGLVGNAMDNLYIRIMTDNRWVLFAIYFVGLLTMRFLFSRDVDLIEHIVLSFLTAAVLVYLDKYMKWILAVLLKKVLP